MLGHSVKIQLFTAMALVLATTTTSASSQTPNVPGQTPPPTSDHLQEMESEMLNIRAESEQLGGSSAPANSIETVQTRINELDEITGRLETVAEELGASTEDLDRLRQETGDVTVIGLKDVAQEVGEEGVEKAVEYCLTRGCLKVASKALGWITLIGDVVEYGGKFIIRELNEDSIRDMVRAERLKLSDLYDLLSALRCERSAERAKVRRLEDLRARENALADQIATERQRLAERAKSARSRANVQRDEDHAGDEEEKRKYLDEAVRPSGPVLPRAPQGVRPARPTTQAMNLSPFASEVLAVHNGERARFGAEPLNWNSALEASAAAYAGQLAQTGRRVHATRVGRGVERENINQGMLHWNTGQMLQNWLQERGKFTPGTFPAVCAGDWSQCGHYTQMIWPTTTDIGCAVASGSGFKWLVCRYSPGGNKDGQVVGLRTSPRVPAGETRLASSRRPC